MSLVKIDVDADNMLARQFTELERKNLPFAIVQAVNRLGIERGLLPIAGLALAIALRVWPAGDPDEIEHEHPGLEADHPHLAGAGRRHRHAFVIDRDHQAWPTRG